MINQAPDLPDLSLLTELTPERKKSKCRVEEVKIVL